MRMFNSKSFRTLTRTITVTFKRHLNSTQTAIALRPFYFAVHPDLFGKHPKERSVNEESLKVLHEYVSALQSISHVEPVPVDLRFYIRPINKHKELTNVKITLQSKDIRKTVTTILQSSGLPLDYLRTVPPKQIRYDRPIEWHHSFYEATGTQDPRPRAKKPRRTLRRWLVQHSDRISSYSEASRLTQQDIGRLCDTIVQLIGVHSLRWENVWGISHYVACLRTFCKLCMTQTDMLRDILQGRTIVFGNRTGVDLVGEILLASNDVTTDWMSLLLSVKAYDPMIERLPKMEQELSHLLNNIQIIRRRKQAVVMAQTYEVLLNKMLNSLRRCQTEVHRTLGDEDLSHLVMVVESESGPLTLTSVGQLCIPASYPGSMTVKFLKENKQKAAMLLIDAKMHLLSMDQVVKQCKADLQILTLTSDDAVTPQQMTSCCQRLIDNQADIGSLLHGTRLKVSTFYTVMRDGEVIIPLNWEAEGT